MPENQTAVPLQCHKHGQTPSLVIAVGDQVRAHYCLICFEQMLARQGVHAMYPVRSQAEIVDDFPETIELN